MFVKNSLTGFMLLVLLFKANVVMGELEVGLGLSTAHVPHYVGSDQAEQYYVPFPYIRYRSDRLNIDRNGIQTKLWQRGRWNLELSFGGAVRVDSEKNDAREGMDDLDFILEAGPALRYYVLGKRSEDNVLFFEMPIRSAISTDFTELERRGFSLNPRAIWRRAYMMNQYEVRPQLSLGLRSATQEYHDYIYGVTASFATSERAQYDASGGYGGWQVSYGTAVLWSNYMVGGFVRYVNINGAVFEGSPLVKQNTSVIFGLVSAYLF